MGIIRKQIAKAKKHFKKIGFADATLTRKTPGARTVGNLAGGTNPTSTAYACVAMVEKTGRFKSGTLVREGHSLITVLGGTLAVTPASGDVIVLDGTTYRVVKFETDPDEAVYEIEVSH